MIRERLHLLSGFLLVLAGTPVSGKAASNEAKQGVTIDRREGLLRIEVNGLWFGDYHYQGGSRPFLYPIHGPEQMPMTRNWPIRESENEERDHPHHQSLWFEHGAMNGVDFWTQGPKAGKTVHSEFTEIKPGRDVGVIRSKNNYVAPDGSVVCTDDRTLRVFNRRDDRMFDFEVTLHASNGDLVLGDTKEGTMAIRLNETMRLAPNKSNQGKPTGHIVNSEGLRDGATWGKRAAWVDYSGPVNGRTAGVAIFDHPDNPRHPTWWHVRDYGLFAANPFGLHDFEKKPAGSGNLTIPKGQSLTFRYRFYLHRGDEREGRVADRYREYIAEPR